MLSEGEWWDATVAKVKEEKIRVHYVGGTDEEDEWVPLNRCFPARPRGAPTVCSARRRLPAAEGARVWLRVRGCVAACAWLHVRVRPAVSLPPRLPPSLLAPAHVCERA